MVGRNFLRACIVLEFNYSISIFFIYSQKVNSLSLTLLLFCGRGKSANRKCSHCCQQIAMRAHLHVDLLKRQTAIQDVVIVFLLRCSSSASVRSQITFASL